MKKVLKYGLFGAGSILAVSIATVGYLAATFNPNEYKGEIIRAVKEGSQRTLHLDGDIRLRVFPYIGASLEKVSLFEYKSEKIFASVDTVKVSLELFPLLRHELIVDDVIVKGLSANIVKHKDGTTNLDDLFGQKKEEGKKQVRFDIASVLLKNARISYLDEGVGEQYALNLEKLETGRIAYGVPVKLELTADANGKQLDLNAQLAGTLTFDPEKKQYAMTETKLRVTGSVQDISDLKLTPSGDMGADLASRALSAKEFELNASGNQNGSPFEARLSLPEFQASKEKISAQHLKFDAKLDNGNLVAGLSLPDLSGNAQSFSGSKLLLNLALQMPDQALNFRLASPVSGSLDSTRLTLNQLDITVNGQFDTMPGKPVSSEMKGSANIDGKGKTLQAVLSGGFLQSRVSAKIGVYGFPDPEVKFDADFDQFDVDLYMPKRAKAEQSDKPFDLSFLRKLNLDGSLSLGRLTVENVKASDVKLNIASHHGNLLVSPFSARLYRGSANGSLGVNANAIPSFDVDANLSGIDIAALTRDAADFDMLEGSGNVAAKVSMQGDRVSSMKKSMSGNVSLHLADGAITGINIAQKLRDAKGMLTGQQTALSDQSQKTDFSELKGTFKINHGVAHNEDLALKSPLIRAAGSGDIDIGEGRMNYLAKVMLAGTLEGQGGLDQVRGITVPVRIEGPFSKLKYTLDFGAMATEAAKQKLDEAKKQIKGRAEEQLKDSLKGLFR